jgi:cell division septal protein FtsQ
MFKQNTRSSGVRTRRRRAVGAAANVRVINPPPRRVVKASRRTYFALYAPRGLLTQMKTKGYWRERRPKFLAAALIVLFVVSLYQLFANDLFYVPQLTLSGTRILPAAELDQATAIHGWNIFFVNSHDVESAIKRLPEVKDAQV